MIHLKDLNVLAYDGEKIEIEIKELEELARVLKLAHELSLPIFTLPVNGDYDKGIWVYFNLADLKKTYDLKSMIVTTPVDVEIADFQDELLGKGLCSGHFPLYTSNRKTIREYFALGPGFQMSPFFSMMKDIYTAGHFMLPSGRRFRTVKTPRSAAGPDIGRFLIGSGESLAILLELTTRIFPHPSRYIDVAFSFLRWRDAVEGVKNIFAGRVAVDHLFLFTMEGWNKFYPEESTDGYLLLFRIPVYDEDLAELRLRYVERVLKKGKRLPEDKSVEFFSHVLRNIQEMPVNYLYSATWKRVLDMETNECVVVGGGVEGAGVGLWSEPEDDSGLILTYHPDPSGKFKWLKKWNPFLFNKLVELKREIDPENILNPHILEV